MIGIDTNVLIRYIVEDDPVQTRIAERLLDTLTPDQPGFITAVVLAETSWVLRSTYGASPGEIVRAIGTLLETDSLVIEHAVNARRALAICGRSGGEFADAFIGAIADQAGCTETVTFDKNAAKRAGMRLLA